MFFAGSLNRAFRLVLMAVVGLATARQCNVSKADEAKAIDVSKLPAPADKDVDFVKDIQPIFAAACYECHGSDAQEAGLRLDVRKKALAGSDSGLVIVPGKSAESRLVHLAAGLDEKTGPMPPKDAGEALTFDQIALLRTWIDRGAKWPDEAAGNATVKSDHWSFQPITRPGSPGVRNPQWIRNPIDAFILAKLEAEGVAPSPEADRVTLLRRVYLDLIGLPPTPEEVAAFLADNHPGAYERVVDRLLESPHYGERWGRHWLDAARYADSDGYEKDLGRPFAWRYRDWVINAINADMPFNVFTIQQLAGDILTKDDPEYDPAAVIATGFHRNTLVNREGGIDPEEDRVKRTIDRTNTMGVVWLGLSVGCANCHTHKYDPITQQEYFSLYGFFNSIEEVDSKISPEAMAMLNRPQSPATDEQREESGTAEEPAGEPAADAAAAACADEEQNPAAEAAVEKKSAEDPPANETKPEADLKPATEPAKTPEAPKRSPKPKAKKKSDKAKQDDSAKTMAQVVKELDAPRETYVHLRGDFLSKGPVVQASTLEVLPAQKVRANHADRLDFARWLVDGQNPLTARVTVNRLWQTHFGRGLVATSDDFGTQGDKPSHPELLDWLASELQSRGWSMKQMHRLIVTSATYRQSAAARPELADRDPYNAWLARQNRVRVEAEIIRDMALSVSGLLNPTVGGPSVHPPQPAGISELTYSDSAKWNESTGPDRYRRGLYIWFQRTSPYPSMITFDAPEANLTCTRRERSDTPLQSLTMLNDVVFVECAQALGRRMMAAAPDTIAAKIDAEVAADQAADDRIRQAFFWCVSREPAQREFKVLKRLYNDTLKVCRDDSEAAAKIVGQSNPPNPAESAPTADAAACVAVARALMNLDEFVTRE